MILMCKNQAVYNTETEEVYNKKLLPGFMQKNACKPAFWQWMRYRYSSGTNTIARRLKGITFGQGNRREINARTHALSFSDCYWVRDETEDLKFEEISPYFVPFWDGSRSYNEEAAPTLYVCGALTKEWRADGRLYKYGDGLEIELLCAQLCQICGVPCEEILRTENGIAVTNFTDEGLMLEQADASGRIDPDDFTEQDVIELFGEDGVCMLTIDAIIGNGDRHAGNFGWLRDPDRGDYLRMAPLYDFDHALDVITAKEDDRLICDLLDAAVGYETVIREIAGKAVESDIHPVFTARANLMLMLMEKEIPIPDTLRL